MKKLCFILAVLAAVCVNAQVQDIPLCGEWHFIADSADHSTGLPTEAAVVSVPHTYNIMDGLEDYAGRAWYERRLDIPMELKGRQLRLQFEAVYHDATVYINGRKAGSHVGKGYTPFSVDITPYVHFGQENKLVVEVDNSFSTNNFPYKRAFDWANDGGIYRPVSLHVSGRRSIRYAHFTPSLNLADSTGTCHVSIRLYERQRVGDGTSGMPKVKRALFTIKVNKKQTGEVVFDKQLVLKQTPQGTFETDIGCGKVEPWHFDHPSLYSFEERHYHPLPLATGRGYAGIPRFFRYSTTTPASLHGL